MSQTDAVTELETLEDFIERLIKIHPQARDDYRLLVLYTWFYKTGNKHFIEFGHYDLQKMPSPESITRAYRLVLEDKPDLGPSKQIRELRDQREHDLRYGLSGRSDQ